jgi:hypothetical protein
MAYVRPYMLRHNKKFHLASYEMGTMSEGKLERGMPRASYSSQIIKESTRTENQG